MGGGKILYVSGENHRSTIIEKLSRIGGELSPIMTGSVIAINGRANPSAIESLCRGNRIDIVFVDSHNIPMNDNQFLAVMGGMANIVKIVRTYPLHLAYKDHSILKNSMLTTNKSGIFEVFTDASNGRDK